MNIYYPGDIFTASDDMSSMLPWQPSWAVVRGVCVWIWLTDSASNTHTHRLKLLRESLWFSESVVWLIQIISLQAPLKNHSVSFTQSTTTSATVLFNSVLRHFLGQHVCQDVDWVGLSFGCGSSSQQDLEQCDLNIHTHTKGLSEWVQFKCSANWCVKWQSLTIYCGKLGKIPWYKSSVAHNSSSSSPWTHKQTQRVYSTHHQMAFCSCISVWTLTPDRGVFWYSSSLAIWTSAMDTYLCWNKHKLNVTMYTNASH